MKFLLTTIPGFEDIGKEDLEAPDTSFSALPKRIQGRLLFQGKLPSRLPKSILSAYKVFYAGKRLDDTEIVKACKRKKLRRAWILLKDIPRTNEQFDKRRRRLANEIGMELDKDADTILRIENLFDTTIMSIHERDAEVRDYRKDNMPFSLRPSFGYCMVRLTDLAEHQTLIDPFCGGGTIPIESALWYGHTISIIGSDMTPGHVKASIRNAKEAKVRQMIHFMEADISVLQNRLSQRADAIVTEFPHQLKTKTNRYLFRTFFDVADSILNQDGRIVALVHDDREFKKLSEGYSIVDERKTIKGGYALRIIILRKT